MGAYISTSQFSRQARSPLPPHSHRTVWETFLKLEILQIITESSSSSKFSHLTHNAHTQLVKTSPQVFQTLIIIGHGTFLFLPPKSPLRDLPLLFSCSSSNWPLPVFLGAIQAVKYKDLNPSFVFINLAFNLKSHMVCHTFFSGEREVRSIFVWS